MKLIESDKELKNLFTLALKKFDEICRENGLRYSIEYGTLIGAVRHKGFIPWDNDIDVSMPRADYEKLMALKYNDGRYEIKSYRYSKNYYYIIAKLSDNTTLIKEENRDGQELGVFIDIFPADLVSERFYHKHYDMLDKIIPRLDKFYGRFGPNNDTPNSELSLKKIFAKYAHKAVLPFAKPVLSMVDRFFASEKGDYYVFFLHNFTGIRNSFDNTLFDSFVTLEFEGISVTAFAQYDKRLTMVYGDYMTLPPEEDRQRHAYETYYL